MRALSQKTIQKRGRLLVGLFFLLALCLPLSACQPERPSRFTHHLTGYFDTVITLTGYCDTQKEFDGYLVQAEAAFSHLHQLFDRYTAYPDVANINTINQHAGQAPVTVSGELIALLDQALAWQRQSPPGVNIALGPVLDLWHIYRTEALTDPQQATLPPWDLLEAASRHTDSDAIVIDHQAGTVYLPAGMMLDVGAVAKGYATEHVAQLLQEAGWQAFAINSGGNVRTSGLKPTDPPSRWAIGIENPNPGQDGEDLLDTVFVESASVVTSGDYQRFYTVNGIRYHHIIDPATLMPADRFQSVTVVTADSGWADFLSTLFFILPLEEGQATARALADVEVLWLLKDGSQVQTDGLAPLLKSAGATAEAP